MTTDSTSRYIYTCPLDPGHTGPCCPGGYVSAGDLVCGRAARPGATPVSWFKPDKVVTAPVLELPGDFITTVRTLFRGERGTSPDAGGSTNDRICWERGYNRAIIELCTLLVEKGTIK